MERIGELSFWGMLGFGLFGVTLLTSPWMFTFLPNVALVKGLLFSLTFVLLGEGVRRLSGRYELVGLLGFALLLSGYFFGWFFFLSTFSRLGFPLRLVLSVAVTVSVVFVVLYGVWNAQRLAGWGSYGWSLIFLVALAGLFVVLSVIPTSSLMTDGSPAATRQQVFANEQSPLRATVFPFSVPVQFGVERFGWLLPELPDEQIFFLLLDGLRHDYVGMTVDGKPITPTLDALSDTGVRFPQYRVQSSWTKPSTASLFTGLYPGSHGALYGGGDEERYSGHVLPKRHDTLAERLREEGYTSFGAVMSGHISSRYQYDQGFDVYVSPGEGYRGDFSAMNQALFWMLKEQPDKGFVYLHVKGPHQPFNLAYLNESYWKGTDYYRDGTLNPEGRFTFRSTRIVQPLKDGEVELTGGEERFLRHLYGAQLNFLDRKFVKPLLRRLEEVGVLRSGLLVVTGDHGEELNDHGGYAHGESLYEETIRTPLIMKFPENSPFRKLESEPQVESIDLTASLTEYAGGNMEKFQGDSFLSLLADGGTGDTGAFRESYAQQPRKRTIERASVVRYPWKYIHDYDGTSSELYNLREDPGETRPVRERGNVKRELRRRIFDVLGEDSVPESPAVSLKEASEEELENLKGLGYLE